MILSHNSYTRIYIRLRHLCSLIFFAFIFLLSCKQNKQRDIEIIWDDKRAVAISIPKSLLNDMDINSLNERLKVYVEKNKSVAMLGEYNLQDEMILFKPLVPLSQGLSYEVYFDKKLIGNIKVPFANASNAPRLLMVYPTPDTLPENLLKMYVQFSGPMREGESQKHISLVDHNNDTLQGVFLDLQPELWNNERTVLTIWFDPGRIKRGLIPNRQLGNPLKKGERYRLAIFKRMERCAGLAITTTI